MARYEQVSAALNNWQTYGSSHGAGLTNFNQEKHWRPPSIILGRSAPAHMSAGRADASPLALVGVRLDEGQKVLLFLAAANRDPRKWQEPDKFDVRRKTLGHVGFGYGIHACVGQMVARLEAESPLTVLARKVEVIELTGEPTWRLNNTIRGLDTLPKAAVQQTCGGW